MPHVGDISVHEAKSVSADFSDFPANNFSSISLRIKGDDGYVRVAIMFPRSRADYAQRLAEAINAVPVEDETEAAR